MRGGRVHCPPPSVYRGQVCAWVAPGLPPPRGFLVTSTGQELSFQLRGEGGGRVLPLGGPRSAGRLPARSVRDTGPPGSLPRRPRKDSQEEDTGG